MAGADPLAARREDWVACVFGVRAEWRACSRYADGVAAVVVRVAAVEQVVVVVFPQTDDGSLDERSFPRLIVRDERCHVPDEREAVGGELARFDRSRLIDRVAVFFPDEIRRFDIVV